MSFDDIVRYEQILCTTCRGVGRGTGTSSPKITVGLKGEYTTSPIEECIKQKIRVWREGTVFMYIYRVIEHKQYYNKKSSRTNVH